MATERASSERLTYHFSDDDALWRAGLVDNLQLQEPRSDQAA